MADAHLDALDRVRILSQCRHRERERSAIVGMHTIGSNGANALVLPPSEHIGDRRTLVGDDAVFADDGDHVGGVADERAEPLFARADLLLRAPQLRRHPGDRLAHEQDRRDGIRRRFEAGRAVTDDDERGEIGDCEHRRETNRHPRTVSEPEPDEDDHVEEAVSEAVGVGGHVVGHHAGQGHGHQPEGRRAAPPLPWQHPNDHAKGNGRGGDGLDRQSGRARRGGEQCRPRRYERATQKEQRARQSPERPGRKEPFDPLPSARPD